MGVQPLQQSIALAINYQLVSEAVQTCLTRSPNFAVAEVFEDETTLRSMASRPIAGVIMEACFAGIHTLDLASQFKRWCPNTRVLILAHDRPIAVYHFLQNGADGYCLRPCAGELLTALNTILNGKRYLSQAVQKSYKETLHSAVSLLSRREYQVYYLWCRGYRQREIAEVLHISPKTVHTHCQHILRKLGLRSREELLQQVEQDTVALTRAGEESTPQSHIFPHNSGAHHHSNAVGSA